MLLERIRFPEIKGKTCRALPYKKDLVVKLSSKTSLFVKGFNKSWSHSSLYELFQEFGEVMSCKISLNADHSNRGYGFVSYQLEEQA